MKNQAIITLSFDDGRKDNYRVATEVLIPNNVPATFNIATGFLEKKCGIGNSIQPLTMEELSDMADNPLFEIAAHGDMHKNDFEDIENGRNKLISWLKYSENTDIGFASPGSGMSENFILSNQSKLSKIGFSYIRTGFLIKTYQNLRNICRKLSRILHWGFLFKIAYKESTQSIVDNMVVTSIPIMKDTRINELKSIIKYAEKKHLWVTFMFHSVLKPGEEMYENGWSYDYDRFCKLISFLIKERNKEKLQVMTTISAFKYMQQEDK